MRPKFGGLLGDLFAFGSTSWYRVVYGDLSVKNVAAKDLPLPVDP